MGEEGADRHRERVVFRVAPEVVGDEHGAGHVLFRDGLRQFEVVEVLADAYVVLDVLRGDLLRALGQVGEQLVQLVGYTGDVGAEVVGEHAQCFGVDAAHFDLTKSPSQAVIS